MKKIIAIALSAMMIIALCLPAMAAAEPTFLETAEDLYNDLDGTSNPSVAMTLDEADGVKFVHFDVTGNNDPWLTFKTPLKVGEANKYAAVKYRTSSAGVDSIDFYIAIAEPHAIARNIVADGEWHYAYADMSEGGSDNKWDGNGTIARFDMMAGSGTDWAIDIAEIAFFASEDAATEYGEAGGAQVEAGLRDFDSAKGDHMSYDKIYVNGGEIADGNDAVIAAKALVDGSDGTIENVAMYGWYGNDNSKIESFGYMIDDNDPVYGEFKFEPTEQAVIDNGGESRYNIVIDVTGLKDGETHKIQAVAKLESGEIVKLNRNDNGTKDRDAYVNYKAQLVEEPDTQPDTQENPPQTGDMTIALIAVVAILAVAAVVIISKRKAF